MIEIACTPRTNTLINASWTQRLRSARERKQKSEKKEKEKCIKELLLESWLWNFSLHSLSNYNADVDGDWIEKVHKKITNFFIKISVGWWFVFESALCFFVGELREIELNRTISKSDKSFFLRRNFIAILFLLVFA